MRLTLLITLTMAYLLTVSVSVNASDGNERKLDPRIKAVKPNQSRGKDFNPFITIYEHDMIITYGKPRKHRKIQVDELEKFLLDLPVSAWPEGRMVSLTKCGVTSSAKEVQQYREKTWSAVNAIFKRLDIEPNYWPPA